MTRQLLSALGNQMLIINPYRFASADPLLTDLVSWWSMDEASGTRADSHGSHDLTDNNTVGQTTGVVSNAASFVAANNESLSLGHHSDFVIGDTDFTLVFWANLNASGDNPSTVVGKRDTSFGSNDGWNIGGGATRHSLAFTARSADGLSNVSTSTVALGADTWGFVIAEYNSATDTISLEANRGTPVTASLTGGGNPSDVADLVIGGVSTVNNIQGFVDEVAIWRRLLTADEKDRLYNSGSGMAYPG